METLISIMSIVFSNPTPKIPKPGIFGSKFKDSYAFIKLNNKKTSETFSKPSSENTCIGVFSFWQLENNIVIFEISTIKFSYL